MLCNVHDEEFFFTAQMGRPIKTDDGRVCLELNIGIPDGFLVWLAS